MKAFQADRERKFISLKLKNFCKKWKMNIQYATSYISKENGFAKQRWKTIVTIKDKLFLDHKFSIDFWAKTIEIANYFQNRLSKKNKTYNKVNLEEKWSRN